MMDELPIQGDTSSLAISRSRNRDNESPGTAAKVEMIKLGISTKFCGF